MTRDQVAMIKLSKFMKKLEDIDAGKKHLLLRASNFSAILISRISSHTTS